MQRTLRQLLVHRRAFLPLRAARLRHIAQSTGRPDWRSLIGADWPAWEKARAAAKGGPRILIVTSVGLHFAAAHLESLLAIALTLRGAEVDVMLCDGVLPACMACSHEWFADPNGFEKRGPQTHLCAACFPPVAQMIRDLGLPLHCYGDGLTAEDTDEARAIAARTPIDAIPDYRDRHGVAVGEHSLAGALRYFARGDLFGEPEGSAVLRRYFTASLLSSASLIRLLQRNPYRALVMHHGIYVPQGIASDVARIQGRRVVTWVTAYRRRTFIFSHGTTYHHELMNEPLEAWENMPWSDQRERAITTYLESRATGAGDWISFHHHAESETSAIAAKLGIDFARPTVGLLTNVVWDAQLHYRQNAFPSMLDWLYKTVSWFAKRPDLQLLIRVHPAELTGYIKSRQKVTDELARVYGKLPANVFLIGPESPVSTYAAMAACDSVLIYGTKTGVELACLGIPVIVAGEAWIRGKGISLDAESEASYFAILERLPLRDRLAPEVITRARRYAYHFFFRRMITLEQTSPQPGFPPFRVTFEGGLKALRPKASPGLDVVCAGILEGKPFICDAPEFEQGPSVQGA